MRRIVEDTRSQLLNLSRKAKAEKDGKTRYEKRVKSSVSRSVKSYNSINMNSLFKEDILTVNIEVQGETDNYTTTISFGDFLEKLRKRLNNSEVLSLKVVIQSLVDAFNGSNVFVRCNCCLDENTEIKLLNGEVVNMKTLLDKFNSGEKIYVYSTDKNGDFKPGEVTNVCISRYTNKMMRVTLDNGEFVETTPDHLFMLRDGSYAPAENLHVGQSLMPMYFKYDNGYESYKKNSITEGTVFCSVYKEVANTLLKDEIEKAKVRSGEDVIQIHHADFNKSNNYPSNLKPMGKIEHWEYHYNHVFESGSFEKFKEAGNKYWETEDARKKQSEVCRKVIKDYYKNRTEEEKLRDSVERSTHIKNAWVSGAFNTEKFREASIRRGEFLHTPEIEDLTRFGIKNYWENISDEERLKRKNISIENAKKASDAIRGKALTEEHKINISLACKNRTQEQKDNHARKITEAKILSVLNECLNNGLQLTQENYDMIRKGSMPRLQKRFKNIEEAVSYFQLNHRVVKIEHLEYDEKIPVYDLSVKDYSNFVCNAGIVLHNCDFFYRFGYWLSKDSIIYGERQNIPSDITNPTNDLGKGCKHVMLVLANHSWLLKVASVVWNYINYMEKHYEKMYQTVIYPAVYGKDYEEVQLDIFDDSEMPTDKQDLNTSNDYGRRRTQFAKGNATRFQPSSKDADQLSIDMEED